MDWHWPRSSGGSRLRTDRRRVRHDSPERLRRRRVTDRNLNYRRSAVIHRMKESGGHRIGRQVELNSGAIWRQAVAICSHSITQLTKRDIAPHPERSIGFQHRVGKLPRREFGIEDDAFGQLAAGLLPKGNELEKSPPLSRPDADRRWPSRRCDSVRFGPETLARRADGGSGRRRSEIQFGGSLP